MRVFNYLIAICVALTLPFAAAAQVSDLAVEAGAAYRHPHSGISVPASLGGMMRSEAKQIAADSLDVSVGYNNSPVTEALTVYIYRNVSGDVPIWFDKARWSIEQRGTFGAGLAAETVASFTPPGQSATSGLGAIYNPTASPFQSTGVRLFPVGDWYVKIRASSASRNTNELAQWMDQVTQQLVMPATVPAAPAAVEIQPCPTSLEFSGPSKPVKQDMMSLFVGAAIMGDIKDARRRSVVDNTDAENAAEPPTIWCRDTPIFGANIGVYRSNGATDGYLLTAGDNGPSILVGIDTLAGLFSDKKKPKPNYAVNLILIDKQVNFPPQDRLPDPQRAIDIVNSADAVGSFNTWGDNKKIEINSGAMK